MSSGRVPKPVVFWRVPSRPYVYWDRATGRGGRLALVGLRSFRKISGLMENVCYAGGRCRNAVSGWSPTAVTIPLAAAMVARGGQAIDRRGELYTEANVGERLAVRNLFDELRGGGQITGRPANFNAQDRHAFANQLDRWLTAVKGLGPLLSGKTVARQLLADGVPVANWASTAAMVSYMSWARTGLAR